VPRAESVRRARFRYTAGRNPPNPGSARPEVRKRCRRGWRDDVREGGARCAFSVLMTAAGMDDTGLDHGHAARWSRPQREGTAGEASEALLVGVARRHRGFELAEKLGGDGVDGEAELVGRCLAAGGVIQGEGQPACAPRAGSWPSSVGRRSIPSPKATWPGGHERVTATVEHRLGPAGRAGAVGHDKATIAARKRGCLGYAGRTTPFDRGGSASATETETVPTAHDAPAAPSTVLMTITTAI
jgi:hypothetical protein